MKARNLQPRKMRGFKFYTDKGIAIMLIKVDGTKYFGGWVNDKSDYFSTLLGCDVSAYREISEEKARELAPHLF